MIIPSSAANTEAMKLCELQRGHIEAISYINKIRTVDCATRARLHTNRNYKLPFCIYFSANMHNMERLVMCM